MSEDIQPLEPKDRTDFLFKTIGRLDTQISNTNSKSALIMAWNGAALGALILRATEIVQPYTSGSALRFTIVGLLIAIGVTGACSSLVAFKVAFPFLDNTRKGRINGAEPTASLFFFGSVASLRSDEYITSWREADYDLLLTDLSDQAATISAGLKTKMENLQISFYLLGIQLILMLILGILKVLA